MFFDSLEGSNNTNTLFSFDKYAAVKMFDQVGFITLYHVYMSNATIDNNVWYHLGAVMTGDGHILNNKIYINGENAGRFLTDELIEQMLGGDIDENAVTQDYINVGG